MREYAVYKGDNFQFIGTCGECAKRLDVRPDTIYYYTTPAYQRKLESRMTKEPLIIIKIEDDE